jgi:hypothetical protein
LPERAIFENRPTSPGRRQVSQRFESKLRVATIPEALGLWLNTSGFDPHKTVEQILERSDEAQVRG